MRITGRDALHMAVLVSRESVHSFSRNQNLESAATLAYYGFLALMPLLLLVSYVLGHLLNSAANMEAMAEMVTAMFPTLDRVVLKDLQSLAGERALGLVGIGVMLWSVTPLSGALRSSLRRVFKSERRLPFFYGKALDLGAIMVTLVTFTGGVFWHAYHATHPLSMPAGWEGWEKILEAGVPAICTFLGVAVVLMTFAPVRVGLWHLCAGALTTTLLLVLIRPVFSLMLEFNSVYGYAFGSLKAIFLLIVWVFYLFAALLFGAEVMANTHRREALMLRGLLSGTLKSGVSGNRLLVPFLRVVRQGDVLFEEGSPGHEMFYVAKGAVAMRKREREDADGAGNDVARGAGRLLWTAREGSYFGEMSLLIDAPRSASAVAVADTELVVISEASFDTILRENPGIVHSLLKELAERLRKTSELVDYEEVGKA
jgi:membrane protein